MVTLSLPTTVPADVADGPVPGNTDVPGPGGPGPSVDGLYSFGLPSV
jgi:hypothetical protein